MLLSFLFDIPIFLPLLGLFLFWLSTQKNRFAIGWILVGTTTIATVALCLFFRQHLLLGLMVSAFLVTYLIAKATRNFLGAFGFFTLSIFWLISGGLYFDLWGPGGNHFMWYSWLDKMGWIKTAPIPTPTYIHFTGFWNLLGLTLFLLYPFLLIGVGRCLYKFFLWLKGIFFGHMKGQTGLWGLLTNR